MSFWCKEEKEQFLPLLLYPAEEELIVFLKADRSAIMDFFSALDKNVCGE